MITRHEAAQRLDIPLEMAKRHDIPSRMSEAEFAELDANPPAWLRQSRANRRSTSRPVWVQLVCDVCGHSEAARPKKWWPAFTYVVCSHHDVDELAAPSPGTDRREYDGIGSRFIGVVDTVAGPTNHPDAP